MSYDVTEFPCLLGHPVHKPHLAGKNSLFRSIFCQNYDEASVYMSKMVFLRQKRPLQAKIIYSVHFKDLYKRLLSSEKMSKYQFFMLFT